MNNFEKWDRESLKEKRIFIYGIGNQSKACFGYLSSIVDKKKIFLFDSEPQKWGKQIDGSIVYPPEQMSRYFDQNTIVVIGAMRGQSDIAEMLSQRYLIPKQQICSYLSEYYAENIYRPQLIKDNWTKIKECAQLLEDEASEQYYWNAVNMRLHQDPFYLKPNENMVRIGEYGDKVELKADDVIIDCGAYIGDTAEIYMDRLQGRCTVHAIEPFSDNYGQLCKMIEENNWSGKVFPYHTAVGKQQAIQELIYNDDDFKMGISLLNQSGRKRQTVNVETLDHLFENLDRIDYIKMDIEGEEVNALSGAIKLISKHKPKLMISAYHKIEDLWILPIMIKSIHPGYRIYAGHDPSVSAEIEFYCIASD